MNNLNNANSPFTATPSPVPQEAVWGFFSRRMTALILGTLVFFGGAGLLGSLMLGHQYRTSQQMLENEIAAIRERGEPTSLAELETFLNQNTHPQGTEPLLELLDSAGVYTKLARPEIKNLPESFHQRFVGIKRGQTWDGEPMVRDMLEFGQPILQRAELFMETQHPIPVRLFNDMEELFFYQHMVQLIEILAMETRHALYRQELDRVQRGLDALFVLVKSLSEFPLFGHTMYIHANTHYLNLIGDLLSYELLSLSQLEELRRKIAELPNFSKVFRDLIIVQRCFLIEELNRPHQLAQNDLESDWTNFYHAQPWIKLELLRNFNDNTEIVMKDPTRFDDVRVTWLASLRGWNVGNHLLTVLNPDFLIDLEDRRNLTDTALSVKIYQLKNQRWPENLQRLNLNSNQIRKMLGPAFFYEIVPNSDSLVDSNTESDTFPKSSAFLWTIITDKNNQRNQQSLRLESRPDFNDLEAHQGNKIIIRID